MIYKLALKYLKENKRKSWMMFITITIVAILISTLTAYTGLVKHNKLLDNIEKYGSYRYAVEEVTEEQTNMINNDPFVLETSNTYQYARFEYGNIGYVEDISLLPIRFIEGSMPTKDNEIAIEKSVLIQLGYEMKLNQTVTLDITDLEGNVRTQEYIVSGIMEDYSQYMLTSSLQIITSKINMPVMNNRYVAVKSIDFTLASSDNCVRNYYIIPDRTGAAYISYMNTQLIILGIAILGMLVISMLFNTMSRSLEERIMLLRGAGATKSQVKQVVWLYILLLTLPAYSISILVSFGFNLILSIQGNLSFYFGLDLMLQSAIVIFLTVFVTASYRAIKIAGVPLIGRLIVRQSRIKVRRKYRLKPLFLAIRHLHLQKTKTLFTVFMLALMAFSISHISLRCLDVLDYRKEYLEFRYADLVYEYHDFDRATELFNDIKTLHGINDMTLIEQYRNAPLGISSSYYVVGGEREASGSPLVLTALNSMDFRGVDEESFNKGEVVIMCLSKMYQKGNTFSSSPLEGYELVENTTIKVGDQISYFDKRITIGAIVENLTEIYPVSGTKQTFSGINDFFVAPGVIEGTPERATISLYLSDDADTNALTARIKLIENKYNQKGMYTNYFNENKGDIFLPQSEIITIFVCIGIMIMIISQRSIVNLDYRKKEFSIYMAIGMEKKGIKKLIVYEGLWLSILTYITVNILEIIGWAPYNMQYNIEKYQQHFIFHQLNYLLIVGFIMVAYCCSSHLLMKEDLKKYVRYKE